MVNHPGRGSRSITREHEFHCERLSMTSDGTWRYSVRNGGYRGAWGDGGPEFGTREVPENYAAALALAWGESDAVERLFPATMYWVNQLAFETEYIVWSGSRWSRAISNGGRRGAFQHHTPRVEDLTRDDALRRVREMGCTDDARRIHDTMLSGEYVARYL